MKIEKIIFLIFTLVLISGFYLNKNYNLYLLDYLYWAPTAQATGAASGSLIKVAETSSVYYLGNDGKRYVFPSEPIYFSWYKNFDSVIIVPAIELQTYPLGGNVVMRAGTKLIKITTNPSVYAVEPGGMLRKIKNEEQAQRLYGDNWAKRVQDLSDAFFGDYKIGDELADNQIPAGSLVKNKNEDSYYYYDGEVYRKITSANAFYANRFYSEYILNTSNTIQNNGESISASDNNLLILISKKIDNGASENSNNKVINNNSGGMSGGGGGGGGSGGVTPSCSGSSTQSCVINNGQGNQARSCTLGVWSAWGSCSLVSCNEGYQISNNTCVPLSCSGSSTQSCVINNGQGNQARSCTLGVWSAWGSCSLVSCNEGYQISNNTCVLSSNDDLTEINSRKLIHDQNFVIPSNASNGDLVGEINNFWGDWENRTIAYSINGNNSFSIDVNGRIILLNKDVLSGQSNINLIVQAEDNVEQEYETALISIRILPILETYFIDPSVADNGNGTKESPYKNWSDVSIVANRNYLQKRGTEAIISSRISINNIDNVTIGAYGSNEARPKIRGWNITGSSNGAMGLSGDNNTIRDLDIDARQSTSGIYIGSSTNAVVDNCRIKNSEWALRTMVSGDGTKIVNSEIAHTGDDGHYNQNHNDMEIAHNYIHHVNQKWNENSYWYNGKTEDESPGDGIQLNGTAFNFNIHHNIIDRSDTGNKFCVLVGLLSSPVNTNGLLENNYCKMGTGTQGFYIERGAVGIKVRYNTFIDGRGIFTHATDLNVSYNLFLNSRASFGEPGSSYKVYNNIFYGTGAGLYSVSMWRDNLDMRNNIFFFTNETAGGLQNSSQYTVITENNFYYPNFRGAGSSTTNIIGNPLFVNPLIGDFRLQAESPAIGSGVNVGETHDFYLNPLNSNINIGLWQNPSP
ncbi:MAG: right-handed parallel beta-helix repeat-containing protein [Patescibacteria group bacterium]|nr:right-handed parallel beta-helix repeat-containing protein [Patescibacteria group bacterium]